MEDNIINKVANSGLITLNLEEYFPEGERVVVDIAPQLWQGLVLKEKDFREFMKNNDWSVYKNKNVAIQCSVDALVPTWAFMLLATRIQEYANHVIFGTLEELESDLYKKVIATIPLESFEGAKVVVKGCSKVGVPISAYVELTRVLTPIVSSLMFGEPCSTVPLYKKK